MFISTSTYMMLLLKQTQKMMKFEGLQLCKILLYEGEGVTSLYNI
jgi:hypothetical protein